MKPILNWLAAAASLAGLFFTLQPPTTSITAWQWFFLVAIVVVFGTAAVHDIIQEKKRSAKKYRSVAEINNYMYNILKNSGHCEICSRDASWIDDKRIFAVLEDKARSGALTFLVHKKTRKIVALQELGAEVIEYGALGFDPITRFTIVNSGNLASSYVAIGRTKPNEPHEIEELDAAHPSYSMATDLIRSVRVANDKLNKG